MITQEAFPVDPWQVRETRLDLNVLAQSESLFALSNGHIGLRGNLDEGEPHGLPGTYLNSFYEIRPLPYAEAGYGYPEAGQTVVDVTNGKIIRLLVGDEPFDVRYGELISHERVLDLRAGTLTRARALELAVGQADQSHVHAAGVAGATQCGRHRVRRRGRRRVRPRDRAVRTRHQRGPAPDLGRPAGGGHPGQPARGRRPRKHRDRSTSHAPHPSQRPDDGRRDGSRDRRSRAGRVQHRCPRRLGADHSDLRAARRDRSCASSNTWLMAGRVCARGRRCATRPPPHCTAPATAGGKGCWTRNGHYLDDFWDNADVEVEGDAESQQAVRFGLFHLVQASARAERRAIPSKGLTGTGYDGHAFWDTEGFVLPVLTYTLPHAVADALRWRASTMDLATGARGRTRPRRRRLPLADHPRAGVLGLLAGRHRGLAHQRRHRDGLRALPHRDRRPFARKGLRPARVDRDRPAVDVARAPRPPRRLAPRRGHRSRRVHGDRARQRLHEPDGGTQPGHRRRCLRPRSR